MVFDDDLRVFDAGAQLAVGRWTRRFFGALGVEEGLGKCVGGFLWCSCFVCFGVAWLLWCCLWQSVSGGLPPFEVEHTERPAPEEVEEAVPEVAADAEEEAVLRC